MSKFFLIDPLSNPVNSEDIIEFENTRQGKVLNESINREARTKNALFEEDNLKWVSGRVIIKVDMEAKNFHTFENGTKIRRERDFNEFNKRITQPVNAFVISAEHIPSGSEILISHVALHDTNKLVSHKSDNNCDVKYFSIPEVDCFAWRERGGEFKPMKNYEFALRVFKPYNGLIEGIEPEIIKEILYIATGKLKGKICNVLKASDYQIIYQDTDGREGHLIRLRHSEDETFDREEITCVNQELTKEYKQGKLLIGIDSKTATYGK